MTTTRQLPYARSLRALALSIGVRAAALGLLLLGIGLAAGCSSGPEKTKDNPYGLTKGERLNLYIENAIYYAELGDVDRMIFQAEKGLEVDPGNERFMFIYGRGYLLRGAASDLQVAIDTFVAIDKKRDKSKRRDWRLESSWGMALERKGVLYDEAADAVRTGERATDEKDPIARADQLRTEAEGFWLEARTHYEYSVESMSGEAEPLNGLLRVNALLRDFDQAVAWGEQLLSSLGSAERLIEDELLSPAVDAQREAKAFKDLRAFRSLEIKTRLAIADLEYQRGNFAESAEQLDVVTVMQPNLEQAHSQRAQVLYELGEYRRAKDSIQRYLELRALREGAETDPAVRRAFELRESCERAVARKG